MTFAFNVATTTVNTEVTGTFTFKDDDVAAVYIDWDDGADNKENANYQWLQYDRPITTDTKKDKFHYIIVKIQVLLQEWLRGLVVLWIVLESLMEIQ